MVVFPMEPLYKGGCAQRMPKPGKNLNVGLCRPSTALSGVENVTVLFDPSVMVVTLRKLIGESSRVVGCVAWMTHPAILSALEGVDSTVLMTKHKRNRWKRRIKVKYLGNRRSLMHHKFLVGYTRGLPWVAFGSFNMTKAALFNLENLVIVRDRKLVSVFEAEFDRLL